jgi:hypothetical protein
MNDGATRPDRLSYPSNAQLPTPIFSAPFLGGVDFCIPLATDSYL